MAWILTALIMVGAAALRLPLLDVPLDRDEGEYAYVARLLLDGIPPFADAHNMKMPGIYAVYSVLLTVFGSTHTAHSSGAPVRQRAVDRAGVPPRPKADGCNGRRRRGRYLCVAHPQRDRAGLGRQCRALRRSPRAECAGAARLGTRAQPPDATAPCRPAPRPRRAGQAARCLLSRLRAARARAGAPVASSRGAARRGDDAGRGARRRDGRARPSPHVLVLDRAVRVRVRIGAPAVRRRARPHEPPRGTARAHVATLGPRRRRWRRAVRGRASAPVARLPAAVRADVRPGHRCRLLLPAALLRAGRACNRAPRRRRGM